MVCSWVVIVEVVSPVHPYVTFFFRCHETLNRRKQNFLGKVVLYVFQSESKRKLRIPRILGTYAASWCFWILTAICFAFALTALAARWPGVREFLLREFLGGYFDTESRFRLDLEFDRLHFGSNDKTDCTSLKTGQQTRHAIFNPLWVDVCHLFSGQILMDFHVFCECFRLIFFVFFVLGRMFTSCEQSFPCTFEVHRWLPLIWGQTIVFMFTWNDGTCARNVQVKCSSELCLDSCGVCNKLNAEL